MPDQSRIRRGLWLRPFRADRGPMWECPSCLDGMLQLVPGSFVSHETQPSEMLHGDPSWEPEWITNTFNCWLRCLSCKEHLVVIGTSQPEWDQESDSTNDYIQMCQPLATQPMLPVFAPDDLLLIRRFLEIAWQFYVLRLPRALREFSKKRDFVESLDRMKYGPSTV